MGSSSTKQRRVISIGVLLAGYSALLGGLFGLSARPLVGVLLVLGGMALAICSAHELLQEPAAHEAASPAAEDL